MKYLTFIFLVVFCYEAVAQELRVARCKHAYNSSGSKLKVGYDLKADGKVKVKRDGYLEIQYRHWYIILKKGTYELDSVLTAQKSIPEFVMDDSIYSVLKSKGLNDCQSKRIQCGNPYRYLDPSYKNDRLTRTSSDSVVLTWESESDYTGIYYVVISNMWNEYIDIRTSERNEYLLDMGPYKKEKMIVYKVISEACYESEVKTIRME